MMPGNTIFSENSAAKGRLLFQRKAVWEVFVRKQHLSRDQLFTTADLELTFSVS